MGCQLIDPTQVVNPSTTEDQLLANADGGAKALVSGLRFRFSSAVANNAQVCETVSDNYDNVTTFVSVVLDSPKNIDINDITVGNAYEPTIRMLALADFGIKTILPTDKLTTDNQRAQTYFFKGMALLMLSEKYTHFPIVEGGVATTASDGRKIAIGSFRTALQFAANAATETGSGKTPTITRKDLQSRCYLALARTYRLEGNKDSAGYFARQILTTDPSYVFNATYDLVNLASQIQTFVFDRTDNAFQPLPRLDFLDPKFQSLQADATPFPSLKTEEAHLILAEIALSNNDLTGARKSMADAATLARGRNTSALTFSDRDVRPGRPNASNVTVRADANSPYISGLIVKRPGATPWYPVSYTNQTADSINALDGKSRTEHIYMLFLLRQHIFFCEGRRIEDLGIKLPVYRRQTDTNPNFAAGNPGTTVVTPSFIPPDDEMDQFTVSGTQVTIKWDMNRVIANNIKQISPFSGF